MQRLEGAAGVAPAPCPFALADIGGAPLTRRPGMRMGVRVPAGFVRAIGGAVYLHACGAAIHVTETPPTATPVEQEGFNAGLLSALAATLTQRGMPCRVDADGTRRCEGGGHQSVFRLVEHGGVRAVVRVEGPFLPGVADAIVASAEADPSAAWDPIAATSLSLAPIPGLPVAGLSTPPLLRFEAPGAARGDAPKLEWMLFPYAHLPTHPDGSPWTDGEIGETLGARAVRELGVLSLDQSTLRTVPIRQTPLGEDGELFVQGVTADGPVALYGAYYREHYGIFLIIGRAPLAQAQEWMTRFQAHVRSYRVISQ